MSNLHAIILAAGAGTRMKSQTAKVLHTLAGQPLIAWVLQAVEKAGVDSSVVVLGHKSADVAKILPTSISTAIQTERLGTGHAVLMAKKKMSSSQGDVLVLCGDAPLIRAQTLRRLVQQHRRTQAVATILTAQVLNPLGYGRVIRSANGQTVERIVEEREATEQERRLDEVNSGAYCFSQAWLWKMLAKVNNRNHKGEYYLTDVIELLNRHGQKVSAFCVEEAEEIFGVNTRRELAQAAAVMQKRTNLALMDQGVTLVDPMRTWIDPGVRVGVDTVIWPDTYLLGNTVIGRKCVIGPGTYIQSARVGNKVVLCFSVLEYCEVRNQVKVGPYSHIRKGSRLDEDVTIGNFAEINRSHLAAGVKMGHMSYLGDAAVGPAANIGAGTITANFDGAHKHPTKIGAKAFIGSGTVIVAPSQVGAGALTGAGAVLKHDTVVPPGMVAVGVPARVIKKRRG